MTIYRYVSGAGWRSAIHTIQRHCVDEYLGDGALANELATGP